jgi:hypothetical protein
MDQVRSKLRQTFKLLLCKPVLDGDILSLNPPKLAQLLSERFQEDRAAGSSAIIQKADAEHFSRRLRLCPRPAHRERENDRKNPHPF